MTTELNCRMNVFHDFRSFYELRTFQYAYLNKRIPSETYRELFAQSRWPINRLILTSTTTKEKKKKEKKKKGTSQIVAKIVKWLVTFIDRQMTLRLTILVI